MDDESDLQFVDTNVLVYAHDVSAGEKHERARALLGELWKAGIGCISIQVLQEFFVNVTRKVPKPLASATARDLIAELGSWTVHSPSTQDVLDAIRLAERYDIAFWDAMVLQSAAQLGCRRLWSEDLNAGQTYGSVNVANPFVRSPEAP